MGAHRYKHRLTVDGKRTGRRIKWLTHPPVKLPSKELAYRKFFILHLTDEGAVGVCHTGQLGICYIKGVLHHTLPTNMVVDTDQFRVSVFQALVKAGQEDTLLKHLVETVNRKADTPWCAPAGLHKHHVI